MLQAVIYIPKILQQRHSKIEFFPENFQEFLMESLVFRARLLIGSPLLKLKTITMCTEITFLTKT